MLSEAEHRVTQHPGERVIHRWASRYAPSALLDGRGRCGRDASFSGRLWSVSGRKSATESHHGWPPVVAALSSSLVTKSTSRCRSAQLQNSPTVAPVPAQSSVRRATVGEFCSFGEGLMVSTRDFVAAQPSREAWSRCVSIRAFGATRRPGGMASRRLGRTRSTVSGNAPYSTSGGSAGQSSKVEVSMT